MSFARLHKLIAYLLSGLGLFGLSLGGELSVAAKGLIALGYVASFFAEGPRIHSARYASMWTGAVVFALAVQVLRALVDGPALALAIEFAAFLQISRLFVRRTGIDYQQIAVLAFVHLVAATVLSTSLSYGLMFVGFVIATPWMLALSHLRREIESNYAPDENPSPEALTAMRRVLASKRVVGPRFLLGTALLSLPLFAMTLSIFVVIPRVGKGFLSFRRESGQKIAGFGDQVELGGFGVIRDDPTVVVRVTPLPAVDERAPRLSLRLRGTSFDHYDGRRWTRSTSSVKRLRSMRDRYVLSRTPEPETDQQMQIVLEHLDEPVVFMPEGTVALDVPPKVERGERFARRLHYETGHDVRYDADGVGLVYSVWVSSRSDDAGIRPLLPESRKAYKQVPGGHERIAELARQVIGDAKTTQEKALRVLRYLNNGSYRYSLEQPLVENKPPLEVFLFDQKSGHCEYFSSAMAILLRTQGVATRNVTGFVGGRYNPYGGYYALRQGDAHSWVEVWVKGSGWLTFDPTPPARASVGPRIGLWSDVNAFIDALRTRWMTSVVGYDLRTQIGLLRQLRNLLARYEPSGFSFDSASDEKADSLGALRGSIGRTLGVLLVLGVALAALYLLWRRNRRGEAGRARTDAVIVGLYRELDRALQKQGHARAVAATPLEHARELRARGVPYSDEVQRVTDCYVASRYGDHVPSAEELAELRQAVARVRAAEPRPGSASAGR